MSTTDLLRYPKVRTVLLLTTAFMTLEFSWTASKHLLNHILKPQL